jgi:AcrR family transcriptional regulator
MTTTSTKNPEQAPSPDKPLRADAQRNRARVLDAAEELFAQAGNGATIEDIAKRAGVGVGTVCRHFPTKQALLDEVLTQSFRELVADADAALASDDEPAIAFERFVHQLAGHQARRRMLAEQMATELELPPQALELRDAMRAAITELLGRAQAAGVIRDDISPADTAMLFAGIAQITAVAGGDPAVRDRYVAVMLDGLRPAAATPLPGRPMQYRDVDKILQRRSGKG